MKLGFIGTGVMGTGIINNLLKADYEVFVYNRTKAHAQSVIDNGAVWLDSPREIAETADVVMTMVGYPKDVAEQYYGDKGIFAGAHAGQIVMDMTTSTPTLAEELTNAGEKIGVTVLDAPVSGGDTGAKNGTLTVMVGGGAAQNWSMDNYGPRVLSDDYEPGFYVKHYIKDLRIALDEAEKMSVPVPMTKMAEEFYTKLADEKQLADAGIQAIVRLWTQFA